MSETRNDLAYLEEVIARKNERIALLEGQIEQLEAWKKDGESILTSGRIGWQIRLGGWWADRPWRKKKQDQDK
jgi:hypothetical protein